MQGKQYLPIPKLRLHKASGKAAVMLDGKYHYLGPYGSDESQQRYDRMIAEWLANRRTTTGTEAARLQLDKAERATALAAQCVDDAVGALTVDEVLAAYWTFAEGRYVRDGKPLRELGHIKKAMRPLRKLYGSSLAVSFGPRALKLVRSQFMAAGSSRTHINQQVARIVRIWRWAAGEELVPSANWQALTSVPGLRHGEARSGRKIMPVADEVVEATLPYCGSEIRALIELQRLCGARSGELVILRTVDIDMSAPIWVYRPIRHKTEGHGHQRVIYFGPKCQAILKPCLRSCVTDFLFSPARARQRRYDELRALRQSPVQPSQISRKRSAPRKAPGEHWTVASYAAAVRSAVKRANRVILMENERLHLKRPTLPLWHPHQLRHAAATTIRREFGLEVAKAVLGHATLQAAQIYAEADQRRAVEVASKIG
ncbi:MAG: tyrosine-type recombinase/integrase [Phycisphaerae bacterium]